MTQNIEELLNVPKVGKGDYEAIAESLLTAEELSVVETQKRVYTEPILRKARHNVTKQG